MYADATNGHQWATVHYSSSSPVTQSSSVCGVMLQPIPMHFEDIAEHGIHDCLHPQRLLMHPALQLQLMTSMSRWKVSSQPLFHLQICPLRMLSSCASWWKSGWSECCTHRLACYSCYRLCNLTSIQAKNKLFTGNRHFSRIKFQCWTPFIALSIQRTYIKHLCCFVVHAGNKHKQFCIRWYSKQLT